ncbi:MAG TPA: hypothetical protein VFZ66_13655 [Herpetosiphonaceae bacterium]
MAERALADRLYASIPEDDPRFAELRAVLATVTQRGKGSPVPRMLGEWALLGFLLTSGKLGTGDLGPTIAMPTDLPDPQEVLAIRQQVAAAAQAWDFE